MRVEIINTGTELLLGNVVNTHPVLFGKELFPLGLRVSRQVTVPDGASIRDALIEAVGRCDVLLITGGLGPTTDDMTREITAELLGLELIEDQTVLQSIKDRCARRGFTFQPRMGRQAMVPDGATVLPNHFGTAPGLYFPPQDTPCVRTPHVFLLPGPPRELTPMFESAVMPILRDVAGTPPDIVCRSYCCVGMGESLVEEKIGLRLNQIPELEIGYCARPNEVDFRIIGKSSLLDTLDADIREALGEALISTNSGSLEHTVVSMLREKKYTLVTAESCTGGLLAHRITNVPGASEIFLRGFVTYANSAKVALLGIPPELLESVGAVSGEVAGMMAENARAAANATYGLATTGIAGPGGGSDEKPVGTVFLALAKAGHSPIIWRECFPTDRETFKQVATQAALNRLRLDLLH
ncbi:MAG: competence/damage-inducible protein A [Chthoniobacterales bacterium]